MIVEVRADAGSLADAVADAVLSAATQAVRARGVFRIALAGGNTPRALHAALLRKGLASASHLPAWDIWFGDERCVPADDAENNFRMASESLLSALFSRPRVHRVATELGVPSAIAGAYEAELIRALSLREGQVPVFDLVVLGVGADGHTASLFPGDPALEERSKLVVATRSPKPPFDRVTFTLPVLCAARSIFFVVVGADKAPVVLDVLKEGAALPAARVRPTKGTVALFVDAAAASLLDRG